MKTGRPISNLEFQRRKRGLTLPMLAERLEMNPATISNLETGKQNPETVSDRVRVKIETFFLMSLEELAKEA